MRRILLLTIFIIGVVPMLQSQGGKTDFINEDGYNQTLLKYSEINNNLNNLDSIGVKNLSDKMIDGIEVDYNYVRTIKKNNGYTLIYVLNEDVLLRDNRINYKKNIIFKYSLGYDLLLIQGNLDDVLLIWSSNFINTTDKKLILNNYRYRSFIYPPLNINYRFSEKNDIWSIRKLK